MMGQVSFHTLNNLIKLKNSRKVSFLHPPVLSREVGHVDQKDAETFSLVSLNKSYIFSHINAYNFWHEKNEYTLELFFLKF